jgi:thioredoxin-like negative regulator of GroEL
MSFTKKQYKAALKKRNNTVRKLDKIYKTAYKISDEEEEMRIEYIDCLSKVNDVNPKTKKERTNLEKPCKKLQKEMNKLHTKYRKMIKQADILYKKAGDIEEKFGIPGDKSYTPVLSK